jgi:segregation and condensation protein B
MRDITERKEAEQSLKEKMRELERFYKIAVERELRMRDLKEQIEALQEEYHQQRRGFQILQIAGGYQMCTVAETAEWVKKMQNYRYSQRLTGASLETLAIIAYKQPVTKIEIECETFKQGIKYV